MAKRSYSYRGYYIEVAVQEAAEKRFEGTATIFGSPESERSGQGPVHRCARMGRTREEAYRAAATSAESWADGPGKRACRRCKRSPTSATGTARERAPWRATQRASSEALKRLETS